MGNPPSVGSGAVHRTLIDHGTFYEGPRWHDGRWWVSDFYRNVVLSFDADGEDVREELHVAAMPSGLGWDPGGNLLVVSMTDHSLLRRDADGTVDVVASFGELCGGFANDMVVDAAGHAFIGNAGFDLMEGGTPANANLVRVDPDGTVTLAAEDLAFPNGSVITNDGSTLIVGETMGRRYTAFDLGANGSLRNRRVWAELPDVGPDGCGLDARDRIWCADAFGRRCVLVEEGGRIVDEIPAPEGQGVFACMLGGPEGRTLLQCCAPGFLAHERRGSNDAALVTTEVEVGRGGLP
jgi:sugar lactone lactonase YvrE